MPLADRAPTFTFPLLFKEVIQKRVKEVGRTEEEADTNIGIIGGFSLK